MSLTKKYLKSKPVCKVTFKLSKEEARKAGKVRLMGEFNDWDPLVSPMKKLKNGSFTQTIDLPTGNQFEFRYLLDDEFWENDWQADTYTPSPVSFEDNSVVQLR